jgi:hypothetical protein
LESIQAFFSGFADLRGRTEDYWFRGRRMLLLTNVEKILYPSPERDGKGERIMKEIIKQALMSKAARNASALSALALTVVNPATPWG